MKTSLCSRHCILTIGFRGTNCEENIDDCAGVVCNSGTCIDGFETALCECPVGIAGHDCGKGKGMGLALKMSLFEVRNTLCPCFSLRPISTHMFCIVDINRELDLIFEGSGGVDSIYSFEVTNAFTVGMWVIYLEGYEGTYFQLINAE